YPNPADDQLTVKYTAEETGSDAYLYIFNAAGEQFLSSHLLSLSASPITMQIDLADYPAGLYLVKLVEGDKTYTTRLVIQ
ncbi:MAG: T9SS type A sorting domain-containing protein, partial [Bacteroidales bacterium]